MCMCVCVYVCGCVFNKSLSYSISYDWTYYDIKYLLQSLFNMRSAVHLTVQNPKGHSQGRQRVVSRPVRTNNRIPREITIE